MRLIVTVIAGLLIAALPLPAMGSYAETLIGEAEGPDVHVMSYNLRAPIDPSPYTWSERAPRIAEVLTAERPTILGAQEISVQQVDDVLAALPGYQAVPYLVDCAPLGNAIIYDATRLALFDYYHRWLSETPNTPSTSWGASKARTYTVAKFRDLTTGQEFSFINTHFAHDSSLARQESAKLIRKKADALGKTWPVVVTGDFNAPENDSTAYTLATDGNLNGYWKHAERRLTPRYGTFTGWTGEPTVGNRRIDWIMRTENVHVVEAAINPVQGFDYAASDHIPVQALVRFQ